MIAASENHENEQAPSQVSGYMASVAFAILTSGWLSGLLVALLLDVFAFKNPETLRLYLQGGIFLAIAFSNPFGVFLTKGSIFHACLRFAGGFIAGYAVQSLLFLPLAGPIMSIYLFLLLAVAVYLLQLVVLAIRTELAARQIVFGDALATMIVRVVDWPNRAIFLILMAISFVVFGAISANPMQLAATLGLVLVAVTAMIALRNVEDDFDLDPSEVEYRAWLDLEPQETETPWQHIRRRVVSILTEILPGALLFAGMSRLAAEFLSLVYPGMLRGIASNSAGLQDIAIAAASGLAVVFFGMMAALGLSLTVMRLIAQVRNWSPSHLRENYVHLLRVMYFRPMKRN